MEFLKLQRENKVTFTSRHNYKISSQTVDPIAFIHKNAKVKLISSMIGVKWSDISGFFSIERCLQIIILGSQKCGIPSNDYIMNLRTQTRGLRSIAW